MSVQERSIADALSVDIKLHEDYVLIKVEDLKKLIQDREDKAQLVGEVEDYREHMNKLEQGLEQRDKTIAELLAERDKYDLYEAEMAVFRQEYSLMLSALEQIAKAEIPPMGSCDSWAIDIARDTIAQVKSNAVSERAVSTDSEVTCEQP